MELEWAEGAYGIYFKTKEGVDQTKRNPPTKYDGNVEFCTFTKFQVVMVKGVVEASR
jgi:hypothetical protein